MAGVFFLTQGYSVEVAGLNLFPIRFLEAAAFARVLVRRELAFSRLNSIDWTLITLYNYAAVVSILRSAHMTGHQFAGAVDPTLCYLALRGLLHDLDDLRWLLKGLVPLLIPFAALVLIERFTGHSSFVLVGAAPELYFRKGIPRCQGSFRHAILLGTVAASFLPLYVATYTAGTERVNAALGGGLCLLMVFLSNSGGPVASTAAALAGCFLWLLRDRMSTVRRSLIVMVTALVLLMEAPVWYLPFKVSQVVGGTGYHRGLLMERAWQDIGKWWIFGMDIEDTGHWMPYTHELMGGADITNQFIGFALKGGFPALLMSIALFWLAFARIGVALSSVRRDSAVTDEFLLWGLGVTMFVHAVSWLGVAYFDQSWVIWLTHFAALSMGVHGSRTACSRADLRTGRSQFLQDTAKFVVRGTRPTRSKR